MAKMADENLYDKYIKAEATKNNLPWHLVKAIIRQESGFDSKCLYGGAVGLMQINPSTAKAMGYNGTTAGLYIPATNIIFGTKYLKSMIDVASKTASSQKNARIIGIAAYNFGVSRITALKQGTWDGLLKMLSSPSYKVVPRKRVNITINYVNRVQIFWDGYMLADNHTNFEEAFFAK